MTTQGQSSRQHLAAARELLVELEALTMRPEADPHTKATTAAAHAILVLAEQVAVVRVLLGGNALSQRGDAQPARQQ
jgi:hypothetical protein